MTHLILNKTYPMKGCITQRGSLKGRSLRELENLLGYADGRLKSGAYICELQQLPAKDQFTLAGYTQVPTHKTNEAYGKVELDLGVIYKNLMKDWTMGGSKTPVKLIPVSDHDYTLSNDQQYPPGSGIPQWVLTTPLPFLVVKFIQGSERY
jgi:hypothetical protein